MVIKYTKMEILLCIDNYEERICNDNLDFSESEKESIKRKIGFGRVDKVDVVNIGTGADWLVVLLIIDIALQLIKVGAELNDGIEGWIGIGKKLRELYHRKKVVSIDMDGATALAIELIAQKENISKLEKLHEDAVNLNDVAVMIPNNRGLSKKPHNYYIQAYRVNDESVYVIGIKSTGEAEIIKHFRLNPCGIMEVE